MLDVVRKSLVTLACRSAIQIVRPKLVELAEGTRVGLLSDLLNVLINIELFFEANGLIFALVRNI